MGDHGRERDEVQRRFADALQKARAEWAAADPAACAARAGCEAVPGGVVVPFFGEPHLMSHPDGEVTLSAGGTAGGRAEAGGGAEAAGGAPGRPGPPAVHVATVVLFLHYLLTASGAPAADAWATFRELPGGLFYAASFADRAEAPLAKAFASSSDGADAFLRAAGALGGEPLDLADAAWRFAALPRVPVAALLWLGDDELPGDARLLFDAGAEDYLPSEDLAGLGGLLCRRLVAG